MSQLLPDVRDYEAMRSAFRWSVPARLNMGVDVCDAWAMADPDRVALIDVAPEGAATTTSFAQLRDLSNQFANGLVSLGVRPGDRVAILLPQMREVVVAHVAIYKMGAIALPLALAFGGDALLWRLGDSGARAIVTNAQGAAKIAAIRGQLPALDIVICLDGEASGVVDYARLISTQSPQFAALDTACDDPALMIYTSGTTGQAKGALHGHRVLRGHVPGVQMPHEFLPRPGDLLWTPADWAWAGGLLNVLLPGLHLGVPVVARRFDRFDPEAAFDLMARLKIRNAFIPPTALRMLRQVRDPRRRYDLGLRTIGSGGEALGAETFEWGRAELGLSINEFYGQTECNLVLASCAAVGVSRPGAIGKAVPGHVVDVIRPDGGLCAADEPGQIAVRRPDPVMFLSYWGQPEATRAKFIGDWMTTGDQAIRDSDGYVRFVGRDDDVITSAGYRIGPGEIEDCLIRHPAVLMAAAVGKPDALRTEIVKAFVVLREGFEPSQALAADIQAFVRTHLSAHEYPREVAFVPELPLTTTGKVIRRLLRAQA